MAEVRAHRFKIILLTAALSASTPPAALAHAEHAVLDAAGNRAIFTGLASVNCLDGNPAPAMLQVTVPPVVPNVPDGPHLVPLVVKSCGSRSVAEFASSLYQIASDTSETGPEGGVASRWFSESTVAKSGIGPFVSIIFVL